MPFQIGSRTCLYMCADRHTGTLPSINDNAALAADNIILTCIVRIFKNILQSFFRKIVIRTSVDTVRGIKQKYAFYFFREFCLNLLSKHDTLKQKPDMDRIVEEEETAAGCSSPHIFAEEELWRR